MQARSFGIQRVLVVLGDAAQHEHASGGRLSAHLQLLNAFQVGTLAFREVGHHRLVAAFWGINWLWGNGVSGGHGLGFLKRVKDFKRELEQGGRASVLTLVKAYQLALQEVFIHVGAQFAKGVFDFIARGVAGQHQGSEFAHGFGGDALFQRFKIRQRVRRVGAALQCGFDVAAGLFRAAVKLHLDPAEQGGLSGGHKNGGNDGDHGSGSLCVVF